MAFISFRLLDRKTDSNSFFKNADGTEDHEKKLNYTNSYGILNPYFIFGEGGKRLQQRYIAGCDIYDPIEQDKQGWKFNLANSDVKFSQGADIVLEEKKGGILAKWLRAHPLNTSSPNHDPELHDEVFFEYNPKAELEKEMQVADQEDEARELLFKLKASPEKLMAIAPLFPETRHLATPEEIYLGLRSIVKERPGDFNTSIGNVENKVLSDILISQKYNVIGRDAKGWFFESDSSLVLSSTTKNHSEAERELVTFLMSREGEIYYQSLLVKKQQKEIEINSPVGEIQRNKEVIDEKGEVVGARGLDKKFK